MKMRISKSLTIMGIGVLLAGSLTACGGNNEEAASGLSGSIQMVGSTSMEKLANAMSEAFMEAYPDVTVTTEFVGSGAGIEAVNNGTTAIVSEMGYSQGLHRQVLFTIGLVLFVFIMGINIILNRMLKKGVDGVE